MVIAAPMANALFPPEDVDASSSDAASSAVDRLSPWAPFSSVSVAESADGVAAFSMELDSSGAVLPSCSWTNLLYQKILKKKARRCSAGKNRKYCFRNCCFRKNCCLMRCCLNCCFRMLPSQW